MKTTIDIPDKALKDVMRLSGAKTKKEAILTAIDDFNRRKLVEKVVSAFGTMDFPTNEELEAGDLVRN